MDFVQSVETGEAKKDYSVKIVNPRNSLNPFQRKVRLGADKKAEIEEDLFKRFTEWESGTSLLRSKCARWVNNSEGISEPRKDENLVWPNASQIFKPITETRLNIVHSFVMNVVHQRAGKLFVCVYEDKWNKEKSELCRKLSNYFNSNYEFNLMYVPGFSEAFLAVGRDGTIGRGADWLKRMERRWEVVKYESLNEFLEKFPTPQDSGMVEEDYLQCVADLQNGKPVSLDEDYNDVVYDGPVISFTEIKDCVWFPVNAKNQAQMIFIGSIIWMRDSDLKRKEKDGIFDGVDEVIKQAPGDEGDTVTNQQDSIEGIMTSPTRHFKKLIHGRYMVDLDGDGIEEKYLVTYAVDTKKFVQFDRYPFYHNRDNLQITGFKKRPNRLLYRGICEMLEDLNEEANIAIRQRIDSRAIHNSPQFMALDSLKTALDPNRPENRFRPGGIWWVPAMGWDKVKPVHTEKRDFGDSMQEEGNVDRMADNILGASELRSGRETPLDPRAPAAKTAMLLSQSASRLDDFIYDFIQSENRMLDIVLKLYAQYGPDKLVSYVEGAEMGDQKLQPGYGKTEIETKLLRDPKIHLQLSFSSILDNPEYLKSLWEEFYARYQAEPMLGAIPETRHKILDAIVSNTPEAVGMGLLPPYEVLIKKMGVDPMTGQPSVIPPQANPSPNNPTLDKAMAGPKGQSTIGG